MKYDRGHDTEPEEAEPGRIHAYFRKHSMLSVTLVFFFTCGLPQGRRLPTVKSDGGRNCNVNSHSKKNLISAKMGSEHEDLQFFGFFCLVKSNSSLLELIIQSLCCE